MLHDSTPNNAIWSVLPPSFCIPTTFLSRIMLVLLQAVYQRFRPGTSKLPLRFFVVSLDFRSHSVGYTVFVVIEVLCELCLQEAVILALVVFYVPGVAR